MSGNTYVQKYGMTLGSYGANEVEEPLIMAFFEKADETIARVMGETDAKVYYLD